MTEYDRLFISQLEKKGVKYRVINNDLILIAFDGHNINTVEVFVDFDDDGKGKVKILCKSIGKFDEDRYANALITCNLMNYKYRWVKFCVDPDNEVVAQMDAIVDEVTCGEESLELVLRMVAIIDDVYPEFMRARWAD